MVLYQEFPPDDPHPRKELGRDPDINVLRRDAERFAFENDGQKDNMWAYSPDDPNMAHILKVGKKYELVIRNE